MSDAKFVKLVELHDAIEAGMLKELLEDEGIPVSAVGLAHRGLLGIAGGFVQIVVEVPERDLAHARALYEALRATPDDDEDADDLEGGDSDEAPDEDANDAPAPARAESPRLKRISAFCALALTFGCGHFYARSYRAGAALAIAEIACFGLLMAGMTAVVVVLPLLILTDLLGGFVAVDRANGVERTDGVARLMGIAPFVVGLALAAIPASHILAPRVWIGGDGEAVCEAHARCAEGDEPRCVARLAERAVELSLDRSALAACAACVEAHACGARRPCLPLCSHLASVEPPPPPAPVEIFQRDLSPFF